MKPQPKTLLLGLMLLCLSWASTAAARNDRSFTRPTCISSSTNSIKITQVVFSDTATIVSFRAKPGYNFRIAAETYLLGEDRRRYKALRGEGFTLGEYITAQSEEDADFKILFEPLPRKTRFFDFIESMAWGYFCFYGVHEEGKAPKIPKKHERFVMTPELEQEFFKADTACVKGRIEGYSRNHGYTTLLFTQSNSMTDESKPLTVDVREDGSFEFRFLAYHPIDGQLIANHNGSTDFFSFYAVPGQTTELTVKPDCSTEYISAPSGPFARKASLEYDYNNYCVYPYMEYYNDSKASDIKGFTDVAMQKMHRILALVDYLSWRVGYTPWERHLAECQARMVYGDKVLFNLRDQLFNFPKGTTQEEFDKIKQAARDTSAYRFMREMPCNDVACLTVRDFQVFINYYEFSPALRPELASMVVHNSAYIAMQDSAKMAQDMAVAGKESRPSFLGQVALLRQMAGDFTNNYRYAPLVYDSVYTNRLAYMNHEGLRTQAALVHEKARQRTSLTYTLPDTKGADILRALTDKYRGKYLLIDFWGMSCGPCRSAIEQSKPIRESLRQHPDIDFLFISDDNDGNEELYQEYVNKNLDGEDVVRVPRADFNRLMELFNFLGIPHYETLDRQGNVVRDGLHIYGTDEDFLDRLNRLKSELGE